MRLGLKIGAMACGVLLILIVVGFSSYVSVSRLIETNSLVVHTAEVLREIAVMLRSAADSDSSVRGYVITDEKNYVTDQQEALTTLNKCVARLDALTKDNAAQQERLASIKKTISQQIEFQDQLITTHAKRGWNESVKLFKSEKGPELLDEIEIQAQEMKRIEEELFRTRLDEATKSGKNTLLTITTGTILALVLVALVGFVVSQDISVPLERLLRATDRVSRGKIAPISGAGSKDELGELTAAYNRMITSLRNTMDQFEQERTGHAEALRALQLARANAQHFNSIVDDLIANSDELHATSDSHSQLTTDELEKCHALKSSLHDASKLIMGLESLLLQTSSKVYQHREACNQVFASLESLKRYHGAVIDRMQKIGNSASAMEQEFVAVNGVSDQINVVAVALGMEINRGEKEASRPLSKLLEQLKQTSDDLRHRCTAGRQAVTTLVRAVESGTDKIDETKQAFRDLSDKMTMLNTSVSQIVGPVDQCRTEMRSVLSSVDKASSLCTSTETELEKLSVGINQTVFFTKQIRNTAAELTSFGSNMSCVLSLRNGDVVEAAPAAVLEDELVKADA